METYTNNNNNNNNFNLNSLKHPLSPSVYKTLEYHATRLLDRVLLNEDYWIYVPHLDAFYQNDILYDDCAFPNHHEISLKCKASLLEKNNEFRNSWKELVIQWRPIDYHEKRKVKYNFLTSKFNPSCETHPNYLWVIDHRNISSLLMDYPPYKKHWIPIVYDAWKWCVEVDRVYSSSITLKESTMMAKKTVMQLFMYKCFKDKVYDDKKENPYEMISDILLLFINKFQHWISHYDRLKGKLGESYVMNGNNVENGNASLMADYTVSYSPIHGHIFDLFVVEIKPIGKSSTSQPQSDFVKLGKEMKRMVDCLVNEDIETVQVDGILVEGIKCHTYIMDLGYDGIYRIVQIGEFNLLRDSSDILLVPKIIEYLSQVKSFLLETANSIDLKFKNNNNHPHKVQQRHLRKREACGSPCKGSDDDESDEESKSFGNIAIYNNDDYSDFYNTPEFVKVHVLEYKIFIEASFSPIRSLILYLLFLLQSPSHKSSNEIENENKLPSSLFNLLI
ncbi:unnamed protein product [Cunninghamella blakesleeana]